MPASMRSLFLHAMFIPPSLFRLNLSLRFSIDVALSGFAQQVGDGAIVLLSKYYERIMCFSFYARCHEDFAHSSTFLLSLNIVYKC
jgi:hypothetical protein